MKNLLSKIGLSIVLFALLTNGFSKTILLSEAIKKNIVKATYKGASKALDKNTSSYWGACIKITLQNLTSESISVQLEPGLFLSTDDSTTQRMMVTDDRQMALIPNGRKSATINAFCTQMHKNGPSEEIAFNTTGNASGNLLSMANFVVRKKYKSYAVQNAIWVITDNNDLSSIYEENTAESDSLRKYVSTLLGIAYHPTAKAIHVNQKITNGKFKFDFENKQGGLYSIFLYNANGDQIQEFKKDYDYPHFNKITVSYKFQALIPLGIYFVRVVRNGNEIVKNFPIQVK